VKALLAASVPIADSAPEVAIAATAQVEKVSHLTYAIADFRSKT
jgi:hypothetical protein